MFIAHLPSGLLLARATARSRAGVACALAGSVFPDLDLLFNFLVDKGAVHHHRYWTHIPLVWGVVGVVALAALTLFHAQRARALAVIFLCGVLVHLVLDTFVGDILWAWPWSDRFFHVVTVPARFDWYVWSFVLHWTFLAEVLIVSAAATAWWRTSSGGRAARPQVKTSGSSPRPTQ